LENSKGVEAMPANVQTYIGRQAAWHKLGTVTGKYQTWAEILAHGGLDFDVFKSQLHDGLGRVVKAWGVFRYNQKDKAVGNKNAANFLGVVGEDYNCINHAQGFEMVDALMNTADGAHYETAGVLGEGETVWGLADLGLRMRVGEDEHKTYLMFATGHCGNMTYTFKLVDERVVCENTLSIALREKSVAAFRVKHTRFAQNRIADANAVLQSLQDETISMERKLNMLAQKRVTKESLNSIMDRLFPQRKGEDGVETSSTRRTNILADILSIYEVNDGNQFPEQRGTAYNLLNAITNYTDHSRSTKGDMRSESALFGSGDKLKTSALQIIMDAAQGMPEVLRRGTQGVEVDFASVGLNVPALSR
jgi:phage/plasmid-like protein (TIGR03299 family)